MQHVQVCAVLMVFLFLFLLSPALMAEEFHPPWKTPPEGGVRFTVPCVDNVPDLHGEIGNPDLVIFFGGNQFMVLPDIMEAFRADYPRYKNIFYETLPPGILEQQIKTGSLVMGNLRITHKPDMFVAGEKRLRELDRQQGYFDTIQPYFRNRLAIMVYQGNPRNIQSLSDLGREDVQVSMPNPETEGIAEKAKEAYRKAGGEDLVNTIMKTKQEKGTTFITRIHHRQTPMRIMEKKSDAGPVWYTEPKFQQMIGNPVDMVEIPEEHNVWGTTAAGIMKDAPHKQAAQDFLNFITSEKGQSIYRKYGFEPVAQEQKSKGGNG